MISRSTDYFITYYTVLTRPNKVKTAVHGCNSWLSVWTLSCPVKLSTQYRLALLWLILGVKTCDTHQWRKTKTKNKEVNIIDPNPNNNYKTKKNFTSFYIEVNPLLFSNLLSPETGNEIFHEDVACCRLSVSADDRKSERAKSGISCGRVPGVYQTPLVASPLFQSATLTESLEQAMRTWVAVPALRLSVSYGGGNSRCEIHWRI